MRFKHTVYLAIAVNARIVDNAGAPVSDFAAPVQYLWFWLPAWIWALIASYWGRRELRPSWERLTAQPQASRLSPIPWAWLFDLAGWRNDLRLAGLAAWLLVRDRRLANVTL